VKHHDQGQALVGLERWREIEPELPGAARADDKAWNPVTRAFGRLVLVDGRFDRSRDGNFAGPHRLLGRRRDAAPEYLSPS
jgi:hypothetical protein